MGVDMVDIFNGDGGVPLDLHRLAFDLVCKRQQESHTTRVG